MIYVNCCTYCLLVNLVYILICSFLFKIYHKVSKGINNYREITHRNIYSNIYYFTNTISGIDNNYTNY